MLLLDRQRHRVDLLNKLGTDPATDVGAARPGHKEASITSLKARDLGLHLLEHHQRPLCLLGVVALVILPDDLVGNGISDHRFHGRRAKIKTGEELVLRHRVFPT